MKEQHYNPDHSTLRQNRIEPGLSGIFHGLAFHTFTGDGLTIKQIAHINMHEKAINIMVTAIQALVRDPSLTPSDLVNSGNPRVAQAAENARFLAAGINMTDNDLLEEQRGHLHPENTFGELMEQSYLLAVKDE